MENPISNSSLSPVEADIRTVKPNMIHRITPRFKSMLHEMHQTGNVAHGLMYLYVPATLINITQMVGGTCASEASVSHGRALSQRT